MFLPSFVIKPKIAVASGNYSVDGSGYLFFNPTVGENIAVNSTFAVDSNWSKGPGWAISGGVGVATATTSNMFQGLATVGLPYKVSADIVRTSGSIRTYHGASSAFPYSASGSFSYTTEQVTNSSIGVAGHSSGAFTGTVDNLEVRPITGNTYVTFKSSSPDSIKIALDSNPATSKININCYNSSGDYLQIEVAVSTTANFALRVRKFLADSLNSNVVALTNVTFVAGAEIELRRSGTTFGLYYNGVQVLTNFTVTESSILNGEYHRINCFTNDWKFRSIKFNNVSARF